jgi:exonuclease III
LRVVTLNANGLRSAPRNGFFPWFARQRADVLCVQELKARDELIATKALHSGVAVVSAYFPSDARRFSDHAPLIIDYESPGVDAPRAKGEAART